MTVQIAFTGPSAVLIRDFPKLDALFEELSTKEIARSVDEVITGACIGLDAYAAHWFHSRGYHVHTIVPYNMSRVDRLWRQNCTTHEYAPGGREPYRIRNTMMVQRCTKLVGIYYTYPGRNGETMTINIAKKLGKPVQEVQL